MTFSKNSAVKPEHRIPGQFGLKRTCEAHLVQAHAQGGLNNGWSMVVNAFPCQGMNTSRIGIFITQLLRKKGWYPSFSMFVFLTKWAQNSLLHLIFTEN